MLEFKNVGLKYGEKTVLDNLCVTFKDEKISVILGESGSGKTSLLNIINAKNKYSGEVSGVPERISYVFQSLSLIPSITVRQNVEFVLMSLLKKAERDKVVSEYLQKVELNEHADKYPRELSGGMRQRVALARAFAYNAELLLLDEPFTSLDFSLKKRLLDVTLKLLRENPKTTVLVTHSIDEALLLGDEIFILKKNEKRITEVIPIDVPQEERSLKSEELSEVRRRIFTAFDF